MGKSKRNQKPSGKEGLKKPHMKSGNINISERHQKGETRRKEKYQKLERKHNVKKIWIRTVIEEVKQ